MLGKFLYKFVSQFAVLSKNPLTNNFTATDLVSHNVSILSVNVGVLQALIATLAVFIFFYGIKTFKNIENAQKDLEKKHHKHEEELSQTKVDVANLLNNQNRNTPQEDPPLDNQVQNREEQKK